MSSPLRIAVLLSGSGTTLQNLIDRIAAGTLRNVEIVLVIGSKPSAKGLQRATTAGIKAELVASKDFKVDGKQDWPSMSSRVCELLAQDRVDLVVLAGYMCLFIVPPELENKVINVHPSLIPAFCGQGMYGERVHQAVVARGVKVTGCTVHYVTNEYDAGPIILQELCSVTSEMTAEQVQDQVQELERQALPKAIAWIAEGKVKVEGSVVKIS